ncbi:MAG: hypothetical protein E7Z95_02515 [Actinomyces succiniciruminis]|nr:hypothetical protein [Actinomyces succiniciruminis]
MGYASSPNQFQPGPYSTPPYGYVPQAGGYPQSAAQPGAWQPPQTLAAGQYPPAQQSPSGFPAYPNAQQPTPYGYIATPPLLIRYGRSGGEWHSYPYW